MWPGEPCGGPPLAAISSRASSKGAWNIELYYRSKTHPKKGASRHI
jgi:hypothetical protein